LEHFKKRNRYLEKKMKQLEEKYELEKEKNSKKFSNLPRHRKPNSSYNSILLQELDELIDETRSKEKTAQQILNELDGLIESD